MDALALATAVGKVNVPLIYKGKVRELYDLDPYVLIVVTDRISAFDYVLEPPIPGKGNVLNRLSAFWFEKTKHLQPNHFVHADIRQLSGIFAEEERFKDRVMVVKKARRIDMECIVRGYLAGGGWRQYQNTGTVNGISLPKGLRKNERLPSPIFTPAIKNDKGHDEDIPFSEMERRIGKQLAGKLREQSLALYRYAHDYCLSRGVILADCKFEFGLIDDELILIDELFTPDSSRFWDENQYALDMEIDSMDKEPVRQYLLASSWDRQSVPDPLPPQVVEATSRRYQEIYRRLTE